MALPQDGFSVEKYLGTLPIWASYKLLPKENGGFRKVPVSITTGEALKWQDIPHFWTLKDALTHAKVANLDGVGFFTGNGLGAFDLDHCVKNGELLPRAKNASHANQQLYRLKPLGYWGAPHLRMGRRTLQGYGRGA